MAMVIGIVAGSPLLSALAWEGGGAPAPKQLDLPPGATIIARQLFGFHRELLIIITAITVFVLILLLWVMIRYRRGANPTPSRTTHNFVIEAVWTVIPVLILAFIAFPSFKLLYFMDRAEKPEMTVKITGHQWYWNYELPDQKIEEWSSNLIPDNQITDDKIRLLSVDYPLVVPVDTTIQILINGADVIHSWLVTDLGVQKSAFPGRTNETWMKIDHEGTYYGQCTQICGDRHGYMPIEVHAVSKEKYKEWTDTVLHSTAKDKMRDANEKVLGISYKWMDKSSKSAAAAPAAGTSMTASR
ncbi:MAG TPA: cytochrome c oxidase subunit II [Alphaproteobacteria bacterium]|jgi:cytochrome c oxidase subunit 2|nr:cytochrome c oxidase subunit II [Alphaproteobacteria bacterium]